MAEKKIKTRIQNKHDLELYWDLAVNFIPYPGELIIYDKEIDESTKSVLKGANGKALLPEGRTVPYTYDRIKIGDGKTTVSNLPFADEYLMDIMQETVFEEMGTPSAQFGVKSQFVEGTKYLTTAQASTDDINAKTNGYKPITPYNLEYAVQSVTDQNYSATSSQPQSGKAVAHAIQNYVTNNATQVTFKIWEAND